MSESPPPARFWLTEEADVRCTHRLGKAPQRASQEWVTIAGQPVLVVPDPVGRDIGGCPNIGVAIKPCTKTLAIHQGESAWIRIAGQPVIRADLWGYTDGTPPGAVKYEVLDPAQQLVAEAP